MEGDFVSRKPMIDEKSHSENDFYAKFKTPAIEKAVWNRPTQYLQEAPFTSDKFYIRGKLDSSGQSETRRLPILV